MTAGAAPGQTTSTTSRRKDPPWPTELRFRSKDSRLRIAFDDGWAGEIPYELLRVESPSAETKGHGGDRPPPPAKKRAVRVTGADPVGRYAIRIRFDDGHDTGLYTWSYLRDLAEHADARMKSYLLRIEQLGLARD